LQDRKEIVEHYRHLISSRYKLYGWIAGVIWASGVMFMLLSVDSPVNRGISSTMQAFGLLMLWYCFRHRYLMLYHFDAQFADAEARLEKYFNTKQTQWERYAIFRLGLMFVLGIAMLIFMLLWRESAWARILASLFITLLVALIIKGWMDFNDGILRHDIQRSLKDQASE
jgi:hypothetical protein